MSRTEFFYASADGKTQIRALKWQPEGEARQILQICHGMVEHIERYDAFASYCAGKGILVVGNDHLGHGKSVTDENQLGYFAEKNGNACVIEDIHTLRKMTQKEYPDLPYFILGHSMGSFLVRQYIILHGEGLAGAVIMGTGAFAPAVPKAGMAVCKIIAAQKGWYYRSEFVDNMGMGAYNKKFGEKDGKDWLSRNPENVKNNLADPLCNFRFTLNAYYNMFRGLAFISTVSNLQGMPKTLPVFFVAGDDDPVGDYGAGVKKVDAQFRQTGMKDVKLKLYPGDRHEILAEDDRMAVYEDITGWMDLHEREN